MDAGYIKIGTIKQIQGLQGQVVALLDEAIDRSAKIKTLFIQFDHTFVPYAVTHWQVLHGQAIIRFEQVDDRNMAYPLKGKALFVQESVWEQLFITQDPAINLVGYQVADIQQGHLGFVVRMENLPLQKLLVVNYQEKELLIPYHQALIQHIDHANKQLIVTLPPGFITALY